MILNPESPRAIIALNVRYATDQTAQMWATALVKSIQSDGYEVHFLAREKGASEFHKSLAEQGVQIHDPFLIDSAAPVDSSGATVDFRASLVSSLDKRLDSSLTVVQGLEYCLEVCKKEYIPFNLWSIVEDSPVISVPQKFNDSSISTIASKSRIILASSDRIRGHLESISDEATSKTRLLPRLELEARRLHFSARKTYEAPTYLLDLAIVREKIAQADFTDLARKSLNSRSVPRLVLTSASKENLELYESELEASGIFDVPGLIQEPSSSQNSNHLSNESVLILPQGLDQNAANVLEKLAFANSFGLLKLEKPTVQSTPSGTELVGTIETPTSTSLTTSFKKQYPVDFADYQVVPQNGEPLNVLLAGADFKFAGDLIDSLYQRSDIELRIDLFNNNAHPQPAQSTPLLRWADVVIAEFSAFNAIWYSQNILPHQKLIVHLHGYELLQDWIDELEIDRVDHIVVASEFYKQKALGLKSWPESKILVIPNSVNRSDLVRQKYEDSRFHLGLVGIVPILKRPDRALDLLERLVAQDPRYVLHVKGYEPWKYSWEWKKDSHQDAYRVFYARLAENPTLLSRVVFEPFGPDIGNWFRKIGWVLSPSYRETFHMAAVEGATSGAVPLAWVREGSEEIIGPEFNFSSTEEIADFILNANSETTSYRKLSEDASAAMQKYSVEKVRVQWLNLILSQDHQEVIFESEEASALSFDELALFNATRNDLEAFDTEAALAGLNDQIKLTVGKVGRLKDIELYVRGISATDDKRFNHFLPPASTPSPTSLMLVKPNEKDVQIGDNALHDLATFDLHAPKYFRENVGLTLVSEDIQFDRSHWSAFSQSEHRFDRWTEYSKVQLISALFESGCNGLLTVGPWYNAFVSAKVADQLGMKTVWIPDYESLKLIAATCTEAINTSAELQIVKATLGRSDAVILDSEFIEIPMLPFWEFDAVLGPSHRNFGLPVVEARDLTQFISEISPKRNDSNFIDLPCRMEDLHIGVIGDPEFSESIRKLVGQVTEIQPHGYIEALDSDMDCVIVDSIANYSGPWEKRVQFGKLEGRYLITRIFDHARQLAIPTVFLQREAGALNPLFTAAARKADCVATAWPEAFSPVLEWNPSSITSAMIWSQENEFKENFQSLLRTIGIPVPPILQSLTEIDSFNSNDLPQSYDITEAKVEIEELSGEKISVILATYSGCQRINGMLESLHLQTLPHNLIEILVVENGLRSETESLVEDFSNIHPDLSVRYIFAEEANVGNARNIGLTEATGKYITFVDDDDILEPNYLLSMWLTAGEDTVVIGMLADSEDGETLNTATPNNNRIGALNEGRQDLKNRVGLLGLNACKLIPSSYAKRLRYDVDLRSGEDAVFMSQLLEFENLQFAPAAPMQNAMYIRIIRDNSVSRQTDSFEFCVEQRVQVINKLTETRDRLGEESEGALNYLIDSQASFLRRYLAENSAMKQKAVEFIQSNAIDPTSIRLP